MADSNKKTPAVVLCIGELVELSLFGHYTIA